VNEAKDMVSKELIIIRKLQISDIYALLKMYNSLSEESKRFFHPGFISLKFISVQWLLAQFALAASSFTTSRKLLLRVYPFSVFLSIVSTDKFGGITGFAFVKVKSRISQKNFIGELGICVRDCWQGKRVGTELMERLLELAKNEHVKRIYLRVLTDNFRAINLYEKYGFKKTRIIPRGEIWRGRIFDSVEMWLDLH
jgi:RimJ/RimL family protein N-acetyltransferase